MAQNIYLNVELMEIYFLALGIASGCSLFIWPMTTRNSVFKGMEAYIGVMKDILAAQADYIQKLGRDDSVTKSDTTETPELDQVKSQVEKAKALQKDGAAIREAVGRLKAIHIKLWADIAIAKREVAYGKLCASDLGRIFKILRSLFLNAIGVKTMVDMIEFLSKDPTTEDAIRCLVGQHKCKKTPTRERPSTSLYQAIVDFNQSMAIGLDHAGRLLEVLPQQQKNGNDPEASPARQRDIHLLLETSIRKFNAHHEGLLLSWAADPRYTEVAGEGNRPLSSLLYLGHLMHNIGATVNELVAFSELKCRDGSMQNPRLLGPGFHRIRKWLKSLFFTSDSSPNQIKVLEPIDNFETSMPTPPKTAERGPQHGPTKDPDHLPPTNAWEKYSDYVRVLPRAFGSEESLFGLRVACATLSLGILSYLRQTQAFYYDQRLIWAMIVLVAGMTQSSGQSLFSLLGRLAGTVSAVVIAYTVWYMVDGKPA